MFDQFPIQYIPPVYRPPSEANSLLLQVTIGCSHNHCTYCDMYREKKFSVRTQRDILNDIKKVGAYFKKMQYQPDKVFLCDGDALAAPFEILQPTLVALNAEFPQLRRVGIYATAKNILEKTEEELIQLAQLKLGIIYLGLESGDDDVLKLVAKGNTAFEMQEASLKIKRCGLKLSTIAMLGLGGREFSKQHALNTAKIIGATSPHFFSILTTSVLDGTPYEKMVQRRIRRINHIINS